MTYRRALEVETAQVEPCPELGSGRRAASNADKERPLEWEAFAPKILALGNRGVPWGRDLAERTLALCILIILSPILCVVGLLVLLDSPGPVLFRQWRVGAGGRLFRFTKFRTYFTDARERFPELYNYSYDEKEIEQVCFKVPNDPRATRVGAWLRQTTLDELPNFWHVLTGHMALVGPRPEIPEMLPHYRDGELRKFTVRPGVTGLAQISGRGNLSFRETVAFDLAYVENQSLLEDLRILLKTAQCVVFRRGAF